jgi:hypothetical protein
MLVYNKHSNICAYSVLAYIWTFISLNSPTESNEHSNKRVLLKFIEHPKMFNLQAQANLGAFN